MITLLHFKLVYYYVISPISVISRDSSNNGNPQNHITGTRQIFLCPAHFQFCYNYSEKQTYDIWQLTWLSSLSDMFSRFWLMAIIHKLFSIYISSLGNEYNVYYVLEKIIGLPKIKKKKKSQKYTNFENICWIYHGNQIV